MLDAAILVIFGLLSTISWSFPSFVVFRFFYEMGDRILLASDERNDIINITGPI